MGSAALSGTRLSKPWRWAIVPMAALAFAGCSQLHKAKPAAPAPAATTAPATARPAAEPDIPDLSLSAIINTQLQTGHYAEGEKSLRHYLVQHPDDRLASNLLRQLTGDPQQLLGAPKQSYVVQAGDSYSTLAARFLGDGTQFLLLARYNGSNNPSLLRAGQNLRLPASARMNAPAVTPAADASASAPTATPAPAASVAPPETADVRAHRLQDESLGLLKRGRREDAIARMQQALDAEPSMKPSNSDAAMLRSQVINRYHEHAIVMYRDQRLDPAIALWDKVLAIDPSFEPAKVYRTRALELKQRLNQL
ncbi:LysM domain-containing protein [Dyella sp.]|uniref:LysM peptidoglycan-binding domain-containing protein n=1 Tax=Dyella sp. TaxID=1869338 RepID=UPI002ED087E6